MCMLQEPFVNTKGSYDTLENTFIHAYMLYACLHNIISQFMFFSLILIFVYHSLCIFTCLLDLNIKACGNGPNIVLTFFYTLIYIEQHRQNSINILSVRPYQKYFIGSIHSRFKFNSRFILVGILIFDMNSLTIY